ncbi:hypothetical protein Z949_2389 [Sulfitobacter guttiformis KCTC 32187]|nr:hypothetical protein Z949_2389 [Sulfitobacter guttiformis KCTC 32187]
MRARLRAEMSYCILRDIEEDFSAVGSCAIVGRLSGDIG